MTNDLEKIEALCEAPEICHRCEGTGAAYYDLEGNPVACMYCHGAGRLAPSELQLALPALLAEVRELRGMRDVIRELANRLRAETGANTIGPLYGIGYTNCARYVCAELDNLVPPTQEPSHEE